MNDRTNLGGWMRSRFRGLRTLLAVTLSFAGVAKAEGVEMEEIAMLKQMIFDTPIVIQDRARAVIVAPAAHRRLGRAIRESVKAAAGVSLRILSDTEVSASDWEKQSVITLGNLMDNRFAETLYRMYYIHSDARYPGKGGCVVRTVHNPWGTGANVVFLGGSNAEGVAAAVDEFLKIIEPSGDIVLPPLLKVDLGGGLTDLSLARPPDLEAIGRELKRDSNRNLTRKVGEYGFNYAMGGHAEWALAMRNALLEHRTRPYMGWDDTHMELWYALIGFDLAEESPALSNDDRLALTRYLLEVLRGPEGVYQQTFQSALKHPQTVRHNHAMLPALDAYFGGHYFKKYYGLVEADAWIRDAAELFKGQESAFKTECDATAYESTASLPLAVLYALAEPEYRFLSNGCAAQAMDRFIGCMDNRFDLSGNGDVYSAFPMPLLLMTNWYYRDGRYQWVIDRRRERHGGRDFGKSMRYHIDGQVQPVAPDDMVGVRSFAVDPEFYRRWDGPKHIPPHRRFDKITFRAGFHPQRQYFLLDGLGTGSHGHDDVNAIVRFTDLDRVFLVDDSYSEGPGQKDHNAVTVIRNGIRGEIPKAAEVRHIADLAQTGFSRTVAHEHAGTDWVRSVVWAKDAYFVVIDELVAQTPGDYRMTCYWRTLGEASQEASVFRTRQVPTASRDIVEDPRAKNGAAVVFKGGALVANIDLPAGDYEASVTGSGRHGAANSVWIDIDDFRLPPFHLPVDEMGPSTDVSGAVGPVAFSLKTGGIHRLTVSLRESPPVRLDRLVFRSKATGTETVLEAEALKTSQDAQRTDFFLEGEGADRIERTVAGGDFSRFWSRYEHASPTVNVLGQTAVRHMQPGDRHRFINLFYATDDSVTRSYRLRPIDKTCALVTGDRDALVGAGSFQREGMEILAEAFHIAPARFSMTGATRLRAGEPLFESHVPISIELDLETGKGMVISETDATVGLSPGASVRLDDEPASTMAKDGLLQVTIPAGRHPIAIEKIPSASQDALRSAFKAVAALSRDAVAEKPKARAAGVEGLIALWTHSGDAPLTAMAVGRESTSPVIYAGTQTGRLNALSGAGGLLWSYDAASPVTALHTAKLDGKDNLFLGTAGSHICRLEAGGKTRWTVQFEPLHPSLRYRAPTGNSDIGGIHAFENSKGEIYILAGVANGWLRCLDATGKQRWEYFGNARAFDQLAVGTLDGRPMAVATGRPSHFGTCLSFDLSGEQVGHNGMGGWVRITTQMRLADLDGNGQDEIVCGAASGDLYLLKGAKLRTAWKRMLGDEITDLEIIGPQDNRRIVAASQCNYVYCLGPDGAVHWSVNMGVRVTGVCALVREGRTEIAAACEDGRIVALSAEDGKPLARYPIDVHAVAVRAVDLDANGEDELIVGLADGRVMALRRE